MKRNTSTVRSTVASSKTVKPSRKATKPTTKSREPRKIRLTKTPESKYRGYPRYSLEKLLPSDIERGNYQERNFSMGTLKNGKLVEIYFEHITAREAIASLECRSDFLSPDDNKIPVILIEEAHDRYYHRKKRDIQDRREQELRKEKSKRGE